MNRVFNFSAGPAMLPPSVMQRAQQEFTNWRNGGASVMEISHRGADFVEMAQKSEQDLRDLMDIPDDYKVLFMQGGGRGQFAAVPLNISAATDTSLHMVTGSWSKGAVSEADKFNHAEILSEISQRDGKAFVEKPDASAIPQDAAYLHFCPNETVDGVAFDWLPDAGKVPLVADMSSCILSQPLEVSRYGIIYAGAQKNIGPSGLAVVIVHESLLGRPQSVTPSFMDYTQTADNNSMYNTPPTFSWYLAGLVFEWLKEEGGITAIARRNDHKANMLYDAIDSTDFYRSQVHPDCRSKMNVPFQLANPDLDKTFLRLADEAGLKALKGHRFVGGMRASIYNAMPVEGVQALVDFMTDFERQYG
ncbi:3-phosphoserine/phosphohydroxythreonine transaminase [Salinimonas chungwhensis]|uniref:3-phosphoserine/phosphohydroxythreonine transaminase n=1 Tax=Salinimonas chungwhensis TaxID=265425 RepID=UPI0003633E35|nr:3-phosphoserine/phosphohydroxythreonine transaminase [Salinimonas chungwhensis]